MRQAPRFVVLLAAATLPAAVLAACGGDGEGQPTTTATAAARATAWPALPLPTIIPVTTVTVEGRAETAAPASPTAVASMTADEAEIRELNEEFIDDLKEERWSKIYELYSQEFQGRCTLEDFIEVFDTAKTFFGEDLWRDMVRQSKLIAVDNVQVRGETATADVTSNVLSFEWPEEEYYVREGGRWRLAPVPGTEGCETDD